MKTYVTQYSITIDEVLNSGTACVVVDETGNPGQSTGSKYLHPNRKSWAAVVLSPDKFAIAARELPLAIETLREICGGDEFHMTDIYRGHKSFKGVSIEKRLGAIAFLAHIFAEYRYPILFQSLDPIGAIALSNPIFHRKLGSLDLRKHDELALWMLLVRIRDYISGDDDLAHTSAHVVLDESGKWKDSRAVDISETLSDPRAFAGQKIYSRNSKGFPLIQLADFAAFTVNRQQWLMTLPRERITDFDLEFLRIVSGANMNLINIKQVRMSLDTWQPQEYDFLREVDDEIKGVLPRG